MPHVILTEEIHLPSPLAEAFLSNRPELLKTAKPKAKLTVDEWNVWMNAFRVFVNTLYKQAEENESLREIIKDANTKRAEQRKTLQDAFVELNLLSASLRIPIKLPKEGDEEDGKDVREAVDSVPHLEG